MSNYNSQLQSNNIDLQTVLQTLQTKATGTKLPELTNEGSAVDLLSGKELIDGSGKIVTGTFSIDSELSTQDDLISQIQTALTGKAAGGGDTSIEDSLVTRTLSSYTNDRVTTIGSNAFYYCSRLTTVSFPNATSIGSSAFHNCSNLTTVSFPNATTIGNYAFYMCSNLTTVSFPNVTSIGNNAFQHCAKLTTVSFPKATSISPHAFNRCSKLTTANFPVAISTGGYTFQNCSNLTTVSFPNATTISNYVFYSCSKLTTVSFPVATTIGIYAFQNCSKLTTVSFPKATSIGNNAFERCSNLKSLYLIGSRICTLSNSNAFTSTPIGGYSKSAGTYGSIYVPASLLTSYQTATNWTYFSSRFVGI